MASSRVYLEYEHQKSFMTWCAYAAIPELKMITCNHNTQKLTVAQQGRWKALGGRPGVPDLFLPVPRIPYHGLYIEFKSPDLKPKTSRSKGGLSDDQIEYIAQLRKNNYHVEVCYSWIEAKDATILYLNNPVFPI